MRPNYQNLKNFFGCEYEYEQKQFMNNNMNVFMNMTYEQEHNIGQEQEPDI